MAEKRKEGPRGTAAKKRMTKPITPRKRMTKTISPHKKTNIDRLKEAEAKRKAAEAEAKRKNPYRKSFPLAPTEY